MAEEAGEFDFQPTSSRTISDKMEQAPSRTSLEPRLERDGRPGKGRVGTHQGGRTGGRCPDQTNPAPSTAWPSALPALKRAQKLGQACLERLAFDWPDQRGVRQKINEEMAELSAAECSGKQADIEEELGDLLFAVVNLARHLQVDAENALTSPPIASSRPVFDRWRRPRLQIIRTCRSSVFRQLEARWQAAKSTTRG